MARPAQHIDVSHQFEFTNLYYRVIAGHVFTPTTLGQNIDCNRADLELGYFVKDTWTLKTFAVGKKGHGYNGGYEPTTEVFYHHDQRAPHNYADVGVGIDYRLVDRTTLSTTVEKLVWGETVFDFKYSVNVRLTRDFQSRRRSAVPHRRHSSYRIRRRISESAPRIRAFVPFLSRRCFKAINLHPSRSPGPFMGPAAGFPESSRIDQRSPL